ncbi:DUF3644 domain-containing protein [Coraliomargarita sp. SDUM461003]|uniref:DUF3644 domain-containing protein n=1 Tax=Thalassobacterium maritimum TaxID=3041265 RepID=A0ABU1B065_9BACT|nr:DUF3644 domain-containing protein [Coraliomargarita sp. SDUM461003]MDQ8209772.1 DUF3644 domain-containing protein [Coraliomargarita sp. SDUM461003]
MKSRSRALFDKSIASGLSAIEVYNKPHFAYREETFSVLLVNSWELLLKARIVQLERNRISSIFEYERRKNSNGELSTKLYRKRNRSGNVITVGLFKSYDLLSSKYGDSIDTRVRSNLEALVEIRDNSIHFFNKDLDLKKKVMEIGAASLKNYAALSKRWFAADLSIYNFFIMPLAFVRDFHTAECVSLNSEERKTLQYIDSLQESTTEDPASDYSLSLEVDFRIRKKSTTGAEVRISNSPNAVPIQLSEEDVMDKYPWDYGNLCAYLKNRYIDFLQNPKYHRIRKALEDDKRYCLERLLDPTNPKSSIKRFYNPNIIREFDKNYTKKA